MNKKCVECNEVKKIFGTTREGPTCRECWDIVYPPLDNKGKLRELSKAILELSTDKYDYVISVLEDKYEELKRIQEIEEEDKSIWKGCGHKVKAVVLDNNAYSIICHTEFLENNPDDLCNDCWIKVNMPEIVEEE